MKKARKLFVVLTVLLVTGLLFTAAAAADAGYVFAGGDVFGVVQSTDGAPIASAEVALVDVNAGEIVAITEADVEGAFVFADVVAGDYLVAAVASGFDGSTAIVVDGEAIVELEPIMAALGRGFEPLNAPTALLIVFVNGPETPDGMTATFGEISMNWNALAFDLIVTPTTVAELVVNAPGFIEDRRNVDMAGRRHVVLTVDLEVEPSLTVKVQCQWLGEGIYRATVTLFSFAPPFEEFELETDNYGVAIFTGIDVGFYSVLVEAVGYHDCWEHWMISVPMDEPLEITLVPIGELPPGVVEGFVYNYATGRPIPGAFVYLYSAETGERVQDEYLRTDARGSVFFRNVETGSYFIVAYADRYNPAWSPENLAIVTETNGDTASVRLVWEVPPAGFVGDGGAPWWLSADGKTITVGEGEICFIARRWPNFGNAGMPDSPWHAHRDTVQQIIFEGEIDAGTSLRSLFRSMRYVTSIEGLENFNLNSVSDMMSMFSGMTHITNLDLSIWDTSNVTNMAAMFAFTSNLTNLDLSDWDTSNVTNMADMFWWSERLPILDLSSFDTRNVVSMSSMFHGTRSLREIIVGEYFIIVGDPRWPVGVPGSSNTNADFSVATADALQETYAFVCEHSGVPLTEAEWLALELSY